MVCELSVHGFLLNDRVRLPCEGFILHKDEQLTKPSQG
jgi:hypothetical protein